MSGKTLILDTNIIIYLSHGEIKIQDFAKAGDRLCISAITYMEALGYPFNTSKEEFFVKGLCDACDLIDLTKPIIDKTIEIRKQNKIKLPDAIIAASAIEGKAELVTVNVKDFVCIKGIKIINPMHKETIDD